MERREGEVMVVGGGIAGSLAALVLARRGLEVTVVDPRRDPPAVFRNEKLGHEQIARLRDLGALHAFAEACWPAEGAPDAYPHGARPDLHDCGAPHADWIRAVRRAWPSSVRFVEGAVDDLVGPPGRREMVLADGRRLPARLAVLATGRLPTLADRLGLRREVVSAGHSVCLGFSVAPVPGLAAQVFPVRPGSGLGYVSVFPMPGELRVNVFSFRDLRDPWTRGMSVDPVAGLADVAPEAAAALAGARLVRRCEARGTDLYVTRGHERLSDTVVIGDAFHAPCPASGTGMLRILNDVAVLARLAPAWLAAGGPDAAQVAAFYADGAKRKVDAASLALSRRGRSRALDDGAYWRARRAASRWLKRAA